MVIYKRKWFRRMLRTWAWIIALYVGWWFLTEIAPQFFKGMIARQLSIQGMDAHIGRLSYGVIKGFVINNLTWRGKYPEGEAEIYVAKMQLRTNPLRLTKGLPGILNLELSQATMNFRSPQGTSLLSLHLKNAKLFTSNDRGTLTLNAVCEGIPIAMLVEFHQLEPVQKKLVELWYSTPDITSKDFYGYLTKFNSVWQHCDFGWGISHVEAKILLNTHAKNFFTGISTFTVDDALVYGYPLNELRGAVTFQDTSLHLHHLLWTPDVTQSIQGEITLDWWKKTLGAHLKGRVVPTSLMAMCKMTPKIPELFQRTAIPYDFDLHLPQGEWSLSKVKPVVQLTMPATTLQGKIINGGKATLKYNPDKKEIVLSACHLDFNRANKEYSDSTGSLNIDTGDFSCETKGSLNFPVFMREIKKTLPGWLEYALSYDEVTDIEFQGKAHGNIHSMKNASCQLVCNLPTAKLSGLEYYLGKLTYIKKDLQHSAELSFGIKGRTLAEGVMKMQWNGKELDTSHGDAQATLDVHEGKKSLLTWKGNLHYDSSKMNMTCKGDGSIFIDRICHGALADFQFPGKAELCLMQQGKSPVNFSVELSNFTRGRKDWNIHGRLWGENINFDKLRLKKAQSNYLLTSKALSFLSIDGLSQANDKISLGNLTITFTPFSVDLRDIRVAGDPMVANNFIFAESAKKFHSDIWSDIEWKETPILSVKHLRYESLDMENSWTLLLEGNVETGRYVYDGQEITCTKTDVALTLPGSLVLNSLDIKIEDTHLLGKMRINFDSSPKCTIQIQKTEGPLDFEKILSLPFPEIRGQLGKLYLEKGSEVHADISCYLDDPDSLAMTGYVKAPKGQYRKLFFENMEGKWSVKNGCVNWNIAHANTCGGLIQTGGTYSLNAGNGRTVVRATELKLNELLNLHQQRQLSPTDVPGIASGEISVSLTREWGGHPIGLYGTGRVAIRKADIFQVPVMKSLGKLVGSSNIGKITELDAYLDFLGSRIVVNRFNTDGTLLSLNGSGEVNIESQALFFQISSEALKRFSILGWVFKPLTWAFQAELNGTIDKPHWQLKTRLSSIVPGME